MTGRLSGKVAVVTGAARGIGRAVAAPSRGEGAKVYALDRLGEEVADACPGSWRCAMDLDGRRRGRRHLRG